MSDRTTQIRRWKVDCEIKRRSRHQDHRTSLSPQGCEQQHRGQKGRDPSLKTLQETVRSRWRRSREWRSIALLRPAPSRHVRLLDMTPYNPRDLEKKVWDCCLNVKSSKEKPFVSKRTQEVFESDNGRLGCRRFMRKHFAV